MMHNVLLITYLFSPSGGVGVPRAIAYARYLPQNGCKVVVLTPQRPATAHYDPDLKNLVPAETIVWRAFNPELPYAWKEWLWRTLASRSAKQESASKVSSEGGSQSFLRGKLRNTVQRILFPDIQSTWFTFAMRAARRIIREHKIDAVIINAPPYSLLKIGVALKREFPSLDLVTDLRDDWLGYYVSLQDGPSDYSFGWSYDQWQKARALERAAFELSTYVSIATPAWQQQLRDRYPDQKPEKFICTTNGYEPEFFRNNGKTRRNQNDKVLVTYFGTLNASRVYSPRTYLEAVDSLPVGVRSSWETHFVGRVTPDCRTYLAGRSDVREYGFLPKAEGVELLKKSDYLLLIATNPSSHAGKLFEYLATGKPIIALSPPAGEIAKILRETRSGWAVDPFDSKAIAIKLMECYDRAHATVDSQEPDWDEVKRYSWPEIMHRFALNTSLSV